MGSDTNLSKQNDVMQQVFQAMIDLKKPKGVSPKEIINLIAARSDSLSEKKDIATKIKIAIINGLKSRALVENNGLLSISKLIEIPGGLNCNISLTELRRRRGRRRRGRGGRRRGRRRRRRHSDTDRSVRISVHDVAERLSKKLDEKNRKENCDDSPGVDSGSPNRSSVKDLTELRRRRRRRSRGRRRRRHRSDIHELRRRRRRRRSRGRRGRRHRSDIHELRRRRRRRGRKGRRRRRRSIDGCALTE